MLTKSGTLLSAIKLTAVQCKRCQSIKVGSKASLSKVFSQADVEQFAKLSLDNNEIHLNADAARKAGFEKQIVHGILVNGSVFKADKLLSLPIDVVFKFQIPSLFCKVWLPRFSAQFCPARDRFL